MSGSPISNYMTVPNPPATTPQPEQNQPANAAIATDANSAKPTAAALPGSTDLDRIIFNRVDNQVDGVELVFEIARDSNGNFSSLSKEQDFRATITDNTTEIEIGVGTLNTTDLTQKFIFTGFSSQLVNGKSYFVKAKFGSIPKTQSFTYKTD
jgi:hypothetical protein